MADPGGVILVVDDDRDFLVLTRAVLERSGYRVEVRTTAPNWKHLIDMDPAVVLMDVMLEGENGSDVCKAIKAHKRLARLPVILISGHGEDLLKKEVDRCGADGFLTKPISKPLLIQLAMHYAAGHKRGRGVDPSDQRPDPQRRSISPDQVTQGGTVVGSWNMDRSQASSTDPMEEGRDRSRGERDEENRH